MKNKQENGCRVCFSGESLFQCPRCNIVYCSQNCYKTHSIDCVSNFHRQSLKDQALNILHGKKLSNKEYEKTKLSRLLRSMDAMDIENNVEESNNEDEFLSENIDKKTLDKLRRLALANIISIDDLNEDLQKDFYRKVNNGSLMQYVNEYRPQQQNKNSIEISKEIDATSNSWRNYIPSKKFIVELNEEDCESTNMPKFPSNFSSLCQKSLNIVNPSSCLLFNLASIIYSYAYSHQFHYGDLESNESRIEFFSTLLYLSSVLSKNMVYQCLDSAIQEPIELSMRPCIQINSQFSIMVLRDLVEIIYSKSFILRLLNHIRDIVLEISSINSKDSNIFKKSIKHKSNMQQLLIKKLDYFLAYVNSDKQCPEKNLDKLADNICKIQITRMEKIEQEKNEYLKNSDGKESEKFGKVNFIENSFTMSDAAVKGNNNFETCNFLDNLIEELN